MSPTTRLRSFRTWSAAAIVCVFALTAAVDSSVALASPQTVPHARSAHSCLTGDAARRSHCRTARQARRYAALHHRGVEASLAATESAPACNLYAANSGSDENNGSLSAPFRSLRKLATSLSAGQVGCLQSGQTFDSSGNLYLGEGETHGQEGKPITITSTQPSEPATITHSLALEYGANFIVVTHVDFNWALPKPWSCWNAEGNIVAGRVISGPDACSSGSRYSETSVQIGIGGKGDSLTYDEITSDDTNICINLGGRTSGWGEDNVIEHDRIHDCGPTVESASTGFPVVNEEWGWHTHGVYDYARHTVIKNNYIYDNARDGVLLYGGGEGAIVEHNIIDHNGAGVWFGNNKNDRVAWNIVTNSTSPRGVADYGIGSYGAGSGNVAVDNCLDHNLSGEVESGNFTATENKTGANPAYVSAEQHDYTLLASSACVGYGPDTAQPQTEEHLEPPVEEPAKKTPPVEEPAKKTPPVEEPAKTVTPTPPGGFGGHLFPPRGSSGPPKRTGGGPAPKKGAATADLSKGRAAHGKARRRHKRTSRHHRK